MSVAKEELPDLPRLDKGEYVHYKGDHYEVLGVAYHTETLEPVVVYRPLYETKAELFVRPFDMFTENVVVNGQTRPRFAKVDE